MIARQLIAAGLAADTPAALISRGTHADQRVVRGTLADLEEMACSNQLSAPALTVIGKVVGLFAERTPQFPARLVATEEDPCD